MRILRSFAFTAGIVLLLAGFTACRKGHSVSQAPETADTGTKSKPITVAVNKPAAPVNPGPTAPVKVEKAPAPDLNPLNMEVTALETLSQFKLTREQLQQLAKLAPMTARKPAPPRPTKVSEEYHKALKDLREALLDDNEVRVADLTLTLEELRDKEDPDFDDVEITDAARRHTPEVLRSLGARQLMGYLSDFAEEFPDPREKLTDAFEDVRKLPAKEWEELRDEVAGQVGWLAAGLDIAAEGRVRNRAADLLNRVRRLKDDEYTVQREELEREVQGIVGNIGPTDVIRHFAERSLAELLANPRLAAAVEGLLKKAE